MKRRNKVKELAQAKRELAAAQYQWDYWRRECREAEEREAGYLQLLDILSALVIVLTEGEEICVDKARLEQAMQDDAKVMCSNDRRNNCYIINPTEETSRRIREKAAEDAVRDCE